MALGPALPLAHRTGQWLGAFQLLRMLGTGTTGAVYLARDSALERDVAIKLLARGSDEIDASLRERFLREARSAASLHHPNVVQIYQIGEAQDFRYIAMEYVEGMSTREAARRRGGRLSELFGIEKMREAADALRLAGAMGICHRDIKPANLLLAAEGTLKIADFGLATHVEGSPPAGLGRAPSIEGTPFYMSPEQWSGDAVGIAADIYSLGCTFYHLLCGIPPFSPRDLVGCMRAHCSTPAPDPKASAPDLDPILAATIRRCMAKRPEDRPAAREIIEVLDDLLMLRRRLARDLESTALLPAGDEPAPPHEARPRLHETSAIRREHASTPADLPSVALHAHPFSDLRNPDLFWDAGPFALALRALATQISRGQRPALLLGAPGTGRTFTCEMLQHKFSRMSVFRVEPQMLFGARLFVPLCHQHGVAVNAGSPQRMLIESFLGALLPRDRPEAIAVLVVDGVDPTDVELLGELDEILRDGPRERLAMILVGSEALPGELIENAAPPSLYAHVSPVVIGGMSLGEMLEYLDLRMSSVAGSHHELALDTASAQLLHARSGGNPRLVNIYCHNALLFASLKQERQVKLEDVRLALKTKSYLSEEAALAVLRGEGRASAR